MMYFKELAGTKLELELDKSFEYNLKYFESISKKEVKPLDILVFLGLTDSKYHFGVYLGENQFIHQYRGSVAITKLNKLWRMCWNGTYRYSKRSS